jgi:hypothetical protein
MKALPYALLAAALLAIGMLTACTTAKFGPGLEPVPGSITYGGQPRTKLTKSPIGSSFPHEFRDNLGRLWEEIYIIQPDRSLSIARRQLLNRDDSRIIRLHN